MAQGDIIPYLGEIARNTRLTAQTLCGENNPATIVGGTANIPAGFNSIFITATTVPATLTFSNGSTYSLTTAGETLSISATEGGSLSGITITAGAVKWVGVK